MNAIRTATATAVAASLVCGSLAMPMLVSTQQAYGVGMSSAVTLTAAKTNTKAANKITVKKPKCLKKGKKIYIKVSQLKKKKRTFKIKAKATKGKVRFKNAGQKRVVSKRRGTSTFSYEVVKKKSKRIKVGKNGKITVKKNTKRGKYYVKLYVKKTATHKAASKKIVIVVNKKKTSLK